MDPGDEYHVEIGRLVHEFSRLELAISMVIWQTLGDINDRRWRVVTMDLPWTAKLRMLQRLIPIVENPTDRGERAKDWKQFYKGATAISKKRNELMHAPLSLTDPLHSEPAVVSIGLARGNKEASEFQLSTFTPETIQAISADIKALQQQLDSLVAPIHDQPSS